MIAVLSVVTLLVSGAFARQPLVYVAMVSLILFFGFLLDSAGRAMPATLYQLSVIETHEGFPTRGQI